MKKMLPLLASAMVALGMNAADVEPQVLPNVQLAGISANGEWTVSADFSTSATTIFNLFTGEIWEYGEAAGTQLYTTGFGRAVSDGGIVVAQGYDDDLPYVWKDGEWILLPFSEDDFGVSPTAITSDGKHIVGFAQKTAFGMSEDAVSVVPVVWNMNDDGTYAMYESLDYPKLDISGRVPQYILLDDVNADGTVIAGCMVDYSGMFITPIVYTLDAEDNWTYSVPQEGLLNPNNIEFPPYPGEAPEEPLPSDYMSEEQYAAYQEAINAYYDRPTPQPEDYMSEESLQSYQEAIDLYYSDPYTYPYPWVTSYMTEEEYNTYQAAVNAYYDVPMPSATEYMDPEQQQAYLEAKDQYDIDYATWLDEFYAFYDIFYTLIEDVNVPSYEMNSARISPNGRYYMMTRTVATEDPDSWSGYSYSDAPMVFDLMADTYKVKDEVADAFGNGVTDNGGVYGATPATDYTRDAVVADSYDAPLTTLSEYIAKKDETLSAWVKDNLTNEFYSFDWEYNPETEEWEEVMTTVEKCLLGTPSASEDLSTFVTWIPNTFNLADASYYYSYVLPIKGASDAIGAITVDRKNFSIKAERLGVISITGEAANISVFDMSGRRVFTLDNPSSKVSTGLTAGSYVVKATGADGRSTVAKVSF